MDFQDIGEIPVKRPVRRYPKTIEDHLGQAIILSTQAPVFNRNRLEGHNRVLYALQFTEDKLVSTFTPYPHSVEAKDRTLGSQELSYEFVEGISGQSEEVSLNAKPNSAYVEPGKELYLHTTRNAPTNFIHAQGRTLGLKHMGTIENIVDLSDLAKIPDISFAQVLLKDIRILTPTCIKSYTFLNDCIAVSRVEENEEEQKTEYVPYNHIEAVGANDTFSPGNTLLLKINDEWFPQGYILEVKE